MGEVGYCFKSQSLGLESVVNARDLGGYVLPDGRKIRKGLLLRGGGLKNLSDADREVLVNKYHLAQVFDFRTENEVTLAPDRSIPRVGHTWLPAIDPETEKMEDMSLPKEAYLDLPRYLVEEKGAFDPQVQKIARHIYSEMVLNEYTQLQYAAFMQIIVNTSRGSIFWHCSQGKDRTGLGSAFLLSALGADRTLIMQDFDISNDYYRKDIDGLIAKLRLCRTDPEAEKVIWTFIGCNKEYFSAALDMVEMKFGSLYNYLKGPLCLTDEDIEVLKYRYLE